MLPTHTACNFRVVTPEGKEFAKFKPAEYLQHISEHVEPWTYIKFPFLKKVGWKGFLEGADSGVYRVAPLAIGLIPAPRSAPSLLLANSQSPTANR